MLVQESVADYLLEHRYITEAQFVQHGVTVLDQSRRNTNFAVLVGDGTAFFVKEGVAEKQSTVANEARTLARFRDAPFGELRPYVPEFRGWDERHAILVSGFIANAADLADHVHRVGRLPLLLASALGRALAALHRVSRVSRVSSERDPATRLTSHPPWISGLHRPTAEGLERISRANIEFVRAVQGDQALCNLLDGMATAWEPETLIHGDTRLDNCVVYRAGHRGRRTRLRIVDWELATVGDPCWDVGSAFAEFLVLWIGSVPLSPSAAGEAALAHARFPLETVQPAIGRFWRAYIRDRQVDDTQARILLRRSVQCCAGRLLQRAFEHSQNASSFTSEAARVVQVAANIARSQPQAAALLLGLPMSELRAVA